MLEVLHGRDTVTNEECESVLCLCARENPVTPYKTMGDRVKKERGVSTYQLVLIEPQVASVIIGSILATYCSILYLGGETQGLAPHTQQLSLSCEGQCPQSGM